MPKSFIARFLPAGWLIILAAFGGASRFDEWQQLVVTLLSAAVLFISFWNLDTSDFRAKRNVWIFLAAVGLAIAMQLVPLPPTIWQNLPGREPFLRSAVLAGLEGGWRPISLTPDLTWAGLFSLMPVAATLAVAPTSNSPAFRPLVWTLFGIMLASAFLGIAQSVGSGNLFLFEHTNVGSAVGVFANRNHHAIFLTLSFPLVAYLITAGRPHFLSPRTAAALGACMIALFAVAVIQAGSRSGLVLGAVMLSATIAAVALKRFPVLELLRRRKTRAPAANNSSQLTILVAMGACVLGIALVLVVARSSAFERLVQFDVTYDFRARVLPLLIQMMEEFSPWGSGYGSFATVYRHFEPFDTLRYTYFNQAHNDVAQVLIEGGIVGALLMITAFLGLVLHTIRILRTQQENMHFIGIVGCMMIVCLFLASFADYPLRTPLLASILIFAATFLREPSLSLSGRNGETRLPTEGGWLKSAHPPKREEIV